MPSINDVNQVDSAFASQLKQFESLWDTQHLKHTARMSTNSVVQSSRQKYANVSGNFAHAPRNAICMGIADIDIAPPTGIRSAIGSFLANNYGYQSIDIGQSVARRYANHGIELAPESLVSVASVIGAVDIALSLYCDPGDKVMLLSPTYGPLRERVLSHQLVAVDIPEEKLKNGYNNTSTIDMSALDPSCSVFLLCHPNNPTGCVLSEKIQAEIANFCIQHNILLITDEVHSEFGFVDSLNAPIAPFASNVEKVSRHIIRVNSCAKAFNLAAIPGASYAIIADGDLRQSFHREVNARHFNASATGMVALIHAYANENAWLKTLVSALAVNREYAKALMLKCGGDTPFTLGQAGYFLWMNLAGKKPVNAHEWACQRGVIGIDGAQFNAPYHLRLNIACHPHQIREAILRLFT